MRYLPAGLLSILERARRLLPAGALAKPAAGPDYSAAQMKAHRKDWEGAVAEYREVVREFPYDAEALWRMAEIYRDRLGDPERHVLTLRRIAALPDGAQPAWIVTEARERLERQDPAAKDPMASRRPSEIELPDEAPGDGFGGGIDRDIGKR